jgi:adenylate cyclase
MAEERVQRRLAAILAADAVGYSRLMHADETGTLAQLKTLRKEVFDPCTSDYSGRIVKTTGDGILVEFGSAVDAVQCAIQVQRALTKRNDGVPLDRRMELRIGINLGDIIVDGEDIYGDGVNVAARLEGLCDAGGVYVSGAVHDQIEGKLAAAFDDLGEQGVKNIDKPIRVYRMSAVAETVAAGAIASEVEMILNRPAVAVLPLENLSGDPEQEYFADGLTEDIITALSVWRSFPVIARNSTFAYKGKSSDIRQVGKELGARYVIEGSVRKAGNRVRVTAQLINAETGHHVWAERYDRDLQDIFEVQDEVTQGIVATVAPELERSEHKRAVDKKPENLDAWDCVQRGTAHLYDFSKEGNARAREMFERAIQIDSSYGRAYTGLAWSHFRDMQIGVAVDREDTAAKAVAAGHRAVQLDRSDTFAHMARGIAAQWSRDHELAVSDLETAVRLNPSNAVGYGSLGHELILVGRYEEGINCLETAFTLNPQDPRNHIYFALMARGHLSARRYDDAVTWAGKAVQWGEAQPLAHLILAASFGHLGRLEEARAELDACERIRPGYTANADNWHPYKNAEDQEHFLDGLRKAGWQG